MRIAFLLLFTIMTLVACGRDRKETLRYRYHRPDPIVCVGESDGLCVDGLGALWAGELRAWSDDECLRISSINAERP